MTLEAGMEELVRWLRERDIPAQAGWRGSERSAPTGPALVVTVQGWSAGEGGFARYLGERFDPRTAAWQECYGRRVEVKLGLDLYAPETAPQEELQALVEKLTGALTLEKPLGLGVEEVRFGPLGWDDDQRRLKREGTARCTLWLVAQSGEDGEFLDFELRGGWKI